MSVTINDILKLPSLQEAKVVGGAKGMSRALTSITVMEASGTSITMWEILGNKRSFGSEIAISAMLFAKDDVDLQCDSIGRLVSEGVIGLILYYVGYIVPSVDDRLVELADRLDFPLIVMPEGRMDLRYSDAICEVMEAVIKDREENTYFATDVFEQVSHMSESARSMSTVLSAIRDRTHCSVFLTDDADGLLNYMEWPNDRRLPFGDIVAQINSLPVRCGEVRDLTVLGKTYHIQWSTLRSGSSVVNMTVVREGDALTQTCCQQIKYVIQTYLNLYAESYGQLDGKQLISAILNDDPEKMRLIADKLEIDVQSLAYAYFIFSRDQNDHEYASLKKARGLVKDFWTGDRRTFLIDSFDESVVVFVGKNKGDLDLDLPALLAELKMVGLDYQVIATDLLRTTSDAKRAYWLYQQNKKYLSVIFPRKDVFTSGDLRLVGRVKELFDAEGAQYSLEALRLGDGLSRKSAEELTETLEVFLLDGERSLIKTAELMFLHKNTIKYRLNAIERTLGHSITRMPEVYDLYLSAALNRLRRGIGLK